MRRKKIKALLNCLVDIAQDDIYEPSADIRLDQMRAMVLLLWKLQPRGWPKIPEYDAPNKNKPTPLQLAQLVLSLAAVAIAIVACARSCG